MKHALCFNPAAQIAVGQSRTIDVQLFFLRQSQQPAFHFPSRQIVLLAESSPPPVHPP